MGQRVQTKANNEDKDRKEEESKSGREKTRRESQGTSCRMDNATAGLWEPVV